MLNFTWSPIPKIIFIRKNKARHFTHTEFNLYSQGLEIEIETFCKIRHISVEQNRECNINLHISSQLVFSKSAKNTQWENIINTCC